MGQYTWASTKIERNMDEENNCEKMAPFTRDISKKKFHMDLEELF